MVRSRRGSEKPWRNLGSAGGATRMSAVSVVAMLVLWYLVSESGLVPQLILPSPVRVVAAGRDLGTSLPLHLLFTLARIVFGYVVGCLLGMLLGLAMQYSRRLYVALDGLVETIRPVPPVALVPLFILLFGFSETGKIILVAIGAALIIVVATIEALERVPTALVRWGLVCGLSRFMLFRRILLPAALPELRAGFRIALVVSIALVIVAEFMGATYGLGYVISVSKITLSMPTIYLAVILLGWLSWGLDRLVRFAFDTICDWDVRARGATQ